MPSPSGELYEWFWSEGEVFSSKIPDLSGAVSLGAAESGSIMSDVAALYVIKADGSVVFTGADPYLEGDEPVNFTKRPQNLSGIAKIVSKASASLSSASPDDFRIALRTNGEVLGWGDNSFGQLPPAGTSGIKQIAAGLYHTLALRTDGTVRAWGAVFPMDAEWSEDYGQADVPSGLGSVKQIAAGYNYSVALKTDGSVVAWGDNSQGQTTIPAGLGIVKEIAAGATHTIALKTDGTVACWGSNNTGEGAVPSDLADFGPIARIWAGGETNIVQLQDGRVLAWGGYIGSIFGGELAETGLVRIDLLDGARHIVAAGGDLAAITAGGRVLAAGTSYSGWASPRGVYGRVRQAIFPGGGPSNDAVFLQSDGTVHVWGYIIPPQLTSIVQVAAGDEHRLALRNDGTVAAWGMDDSYGQISGAPPGPEEEMTYSVDKVRINGTILSDVVAVASAGRHNLALKRDGTLVGWGANDFGQASVPSGLTDVVAIATSSVHSLALRSDGTVVAWGGEFPEGSEWMDLGQTDVPLGLSNVVQILAADDYSIALRRDGSVRIWGAVGNDPYSDLWSFRYLRDIPTDASMAVRLAAGRDMALAIRSDQRVVGWGYNGMLSGEFGIRARLTPPWERLVSVVVGESGNFAVVQPSGPLVPEITQHPANQLGAEPGRTFVFSVAANGGTSLAYQWLFNGKPLSGADKSQLSITASARTAGVYTVRVSNAEGGVVSNAAELRLRPAADWEWKDGGDLHPMAASGGNVTFEVSVTRKPPFSGVTFQWFKNGRALAGQNSPKLILSAIEPREAGLYTLKITTSEGTVETEGRRLAVLDPMVLVYKVRARESAYGLTGVQDTRLAGYLVLDRNAGNPSGEFIWTESRKGGPKLYRRELRLDLATHAAGAGNRAIVVASAVRVSGEFPQRDEEVLWFSGTEGVIKLDAMKFIGGAATMSGSILAKSHDANGTHITVNKVSLSLDRDLTMALGARPFVEVGDAVEARLRAAEFQEAVAR